MFSEELITLSVVSLGRKSTIFSFLIHSHLPVNEVVTGTFELLVEEEVDGTWLTKPVVRDEEVTGSGEEVE